MAEISGRNDRIQRSRMIMKKLCFENRYYRYSLFAAETGTLFGGTFLPAGYGGEITPSRCFPYEFFANADYEELTAPHGNRYLYTKSAMRAVLVGQEEVPISGGTDHILILSDAEKGLKYRLHYEVREDSPALRRYTEVRNCGTLPVVLNHVTGFVLSGFPYTGMDDEKSLYLHAFTSGWSYEGEHTVSSFAEQRNYPRGLTGYCTSTTAGWACQDKIPCFIIEQRNANLFTALQIEHSGPWRFETGAETFYDGSRFYMQCGMGNDVSAGWNTDLLPGQRFVTPAVSAAVSTGDIDTVLNLLHIHQEKALIRRSSADAFLPVIFNDWLSLMGNVSEDGIISMLDRLRDIGVECYVTDAGWFTGVIPPENDWNTMVGSWIYNKDRFPSGMEYLTEQIRSRGMIAGIWCEIEAVGPHSPIYNDREMLLTRDGHFIANNGRRFLDFTCEKTVSYADAVFAMIYGWGFRYVKIDYNADPGPSSDAGNSRFGGDGIHKNRAAYDRWLQGIREKYPDLIIESCSSGGMRLEYCSLSRADLASLTDQSDPRIIGMMTYNISRVIHPSQCGIWVPSDNVGNDTDALISALCSALAGRIHLSGNFCMSTPRNLSVTAEAIAFYKKFRHMIPSCRTYHPSGDIFYYDTEVPYALELASDNGKEGLFVLKNFDTETAAAHGDIPVKGLITGDYIVSSFPEGKETAVHIEENGTLPEELYRGSPAVVLYLCRR